MNRYLWGMVGCDVTQKYARAIESCMASSVYGKNHDTGWIQYSYTDGGAQWKKGIAWGNLSHKVSESGRIITTVETNPLTGAPNAIRWYSDYQAKWAWNATTSSLQRHAYVVEHYLWKNHPVSGAITAKLIGNDQTNFKIYVTYEIQNVNDRPKNFTAHHLVNGMLKGSAHRCIEQAFGRKVELHVATNLATTYK